MKPAYSYLADAEHRCQLPDPHGFAPGALIACDTCWERWRCGQGWPDQTWRYWWALTPAWASYDVVKPTPADRLTPQETPK